MPPFKFRPALESLDTRVVPSAVLTAPTGPCQVVISAPPAAHPAHGTGQGTYTELDMTPVDGGLQRTLHGTVTLQHLGTFDLSGWASGTGMIQNGRAMGHLVLTNAKGSLMLDLHGLPQPGFNPIPSELVYSVAGGTGAYAGTRGYGLTHLSFAPNPTPLPAVTPTSPPLPAHGGHFSITLS
jgi:hypothetical protein